MLTWEEAREHLKAGEAIRRAGWRYEERWKLIDGEAPTTAGNT
jgi:hypothetical protein